MRLGLIDAALLALAAGAACGPARQPLSFPRPPGERVEPALPPIPFRDGPLALDVVYPPEGAELAVRDSTFVYGSTGTGRAYLVINDVPVPVQPNGAFLAFLPVPRDSVYRVGAAARGETVRLERRVGVPPPPPEPPRDSAVIVDGSIFPEGAWTVRPGERIEIGFQGTAGGEAALVFDDGIRIPLVEDTAVIPATEGERAFSVGAAEPEGDEARGLSEYRGFFAADRSVLALDPAVPRPTLAGLASLAMTGTLELVVAGDTARAPLPLNLALLDDPRAGVAFEAEPLPAGPGRVRASPGPGLTYHYFWPNRTELALTGERNDEYRVRLAADLHAWVPAEQVVVLPRGTPPPGGQVGTVRFTHYADAVDIRIALDDRLPFRIDEGERSVEVTLYGGTANTGWLQYGGLDPLIERAEWSQPADDIYRLTLHLSKRPWGYQSFWATNGDLIVRIRRPPEIDAERPLRGRLIALDPGHPPAGAIGPTRLTEPEANLAIARRLQRLLEREGARVLMTRTDMSALGLYERAQMAVDADADLFVSIHNNAFPDGVNPFENYHTIVYYFHPHSVELAQAIQRELVEELRLRDFGVGRASLAVVRRPTWMPAVLSESMFVIVPQQEAALRDPEVQERIAAAHLRGIEAFLRARATEP